MTDEEIKQAELEKQKSAEAEKKSLEGKSATELIDIIRETRTEAKERRLKNKELEERLNLIETDKQKAETEKKIAEGKKDEVIAELQKKITDQEKDFEPVKEKAKKYDDYDAAKRADLKSKLGESWMDSFNMMSLIELEKLATKLDPNIKLADHDNGTNKKKQEGEYYSLDELKALTSKQLSDKDILAKANKSMEFHSKK